MMWRLPITVLRTRTLERLRGERDLALADRRGAMNAAAKAGRQRVESERRLAQLASDLRLLRVHIDATHSGSDKIVASFELHRALLDGYRRNEDFRALAGHLVEDALLRQAPAAIRSGWL